MSTNRLDPSPIDADDRLYAVVGDDLNAMTKVVNRDLMANTCCTNGIIVWTIIPIGWYLLASLR